ncbi:MAG: sensor histidine kinase, partial [Flavisolibacter sp.]
HEHREAHDKGMKRFLLTGVSQVLNKSIDITALNKKGDQFYISLTISTVRQGGETCFIAFIRDITQQKFNEIELERKRKELESSNKELEQFAHVASHDMKEPIRKIKVFGSRMETDFGDTLPDQANKYLHKILEAAERLSLMVEGVLNYSMINNNQGSLEPINFEQIIEQIKNDLELLIQKKNASIQVKSCTPFEGIPFLIYQLFYNLINNSLKFTRDGIEPKIEISCKMFSAEDSKNRFIEIILSDNGIGFEQEHADNIFNTFTRLNSKDAYEGTGLGLTLCKNIVERHQGNIKAEGKPGEGSTFKIILPEKQGRES